MRNHAIILLLTWISMVGVVHAQSAREFPLRKVEIGCMYIHSFKDNVVIDNQKEYNSLLRFKNNHTTCGGYQLPTIDLEENVLLGMPVSFGSCPTPDYERKFYVDENGEFHFQVNIIRKGVCRRLYADVVWVLVPRVMRYPEKIHFKTDFNLPK